MTPRDARRRRRAAGFTLLEVLVAFVIAALALGAVARATMAGLQSLAATARQEEALSRARSRLAIALGGAPLLPGRLQGEDGGGFAWEVEIAPLETTPPRPLANRGPRARLQVQTSLLVVRVRVSWAEAGRSEAVREVRLETRRVVSAAP